MPVEWTPKSWEEFFFHYQKETGKTLEDISNDTGLSVDELKDLVSLKGKNMLRKLYIKLLYAGLKGKL